MISYSYDFYYQCRALYNHILYMIMYVIISYIIFLRIPRKVSNVVFYEFSLVPLRGRCASTCWLKLGQDPRWEACIEQLAEHGKVHFLGKMARKLRFEGFRDVPG